MRFTKGHPLLGPGITEEVRAASRTPEAVEKRSRSVAASWQNKEVRQKRIEGFQRARVAGKQFGYQKGSVPANKGTVGVYTHSAETRLRMSKIHTGQPHPRMKGRPPWNKGLVGVQVAWNKGCKGGPWKTEEGRQRSLAAFARTAGWCRRI